MKNILIITILISLSGCFETEETHTVDFFLKNKTLMNETLTKCDNNVGELGETPNCKNAYMALNKSTSGTSSDLHL
ncbi:hypothetical protein BHECKSOX_1659 [Bathymodiolus heckerae thiotrophic gill symbiont]|uniref:EexN family lipoprotein n=1 Tax=Bathymodiolus heckerae thiotrophic gill symbiont TaxID=1052212 RepID=UPI0010BC92EE|nr:EexN family lipoprotein [Bathymodiolus heckerae thiotrophic gill symbiont]SHN91354.1 hypothetical protein BHECKSOX_1659 [Bathymodiolus heckerae thiotrophic gill symbiont]